MIVFPSEIIVFVMVKEMFISIIGPREFQKIKYPIDHIAHFGARVTVFDLVSFFVN